MLSSTVKKQLCNFNSFLRLFNYLNFCIFFSGYVIEKRDLTHGGGWVPAVTYVNPKYNHSPVPRLLEGTKYEFRVCAENVQGRSDPLTTDKPIVAKNQYGNNSFSIILLRNCNDTHNNIGSISLI